MPKAQQVNAWASYDNTAKNARRLQSSDHGDGDAAIRRRVKTNMTSTSNHSTNIGTSGHNNSSSANLGTSGHNSFFSQDNKDALKDLEGGFGTRRRLSTSHHSTDLLMGNVSRHGTSKIFIDFVNQQMFDGNNERENGDEDQEKVGKNKDTTTEEGEEEKPITRTPSTSSLKLWAAMKEEEDEEVEELKDSKPNLLDLNSKEILKIREAFPIFFDTEILEGGCSKKQSCSIGSFLSLFNATMPWVQDRLDYNNSRVLLFVEMCLRGVGQVYFQNSPLSGLLVLIGLFLQSPTVAVHGVIGLVCGNLVALGLGFDKGLARSGLFGYNSVLVGLAIATFDSNSEYHAAKIIMVILFASFSSVIFVMLGKMLVPYKSPPLTFPFVLATLMFLLSTANMDRIDYGSVRPPSLPDYSNSQNIVSSITWMDFIKGSVRGVGQVYFADNLISGLLIIAGIAVCSRISAVAAFLGSALGAAIAIATGVPSTAVAQGMYGFNASLSVTAMLMFYNPSGGASILAVFAGIMSVPAQQALGSLLQPLGLPFMTLPFCVISLSFIIIQGTTAMVLAVPLADMTVPEDHLDRINRLEDGMNLLKESIVHEGEAKIHSKELESSFRMIQDAVYEKEKSAALEQSRRFSFSLAEGLFVNKNVIEVKQKAHELFRILVKKTDGRKYLTIQEILSCFRQAGVEEGEPISLASVILGLTDHDSDRTIDEIEFVCFSMVASAAKHIRMLLFKFFDFVDADASGSIDFYEIDMALEYLGRSCLTDEEKLRLIELSSSMKSADDAIEIIELIDIVTLEKIKILLQSA